MKKLLFPILIVLVGTMVLPQNIFAQGCLEADIIVAVDWSNSVSSKRQEMVDALYTYSRAFTLRKDGIKLGILSFGDTSRIEAPITSDTNYIDLGLASLFSDKAGHSTRCGEIPGYASVLFNQSASERGKIPEKRFLIFISDGDVENKDYVAQDFLTFAASQNVVVCAIQINSDLAIERSATKFMRDIATPGFYFTSSYSKIQSFLRTLDLCM